jgi:N4-gp56 family major capsid protein
MAQTGIVANDNLLMSYFEKRAMAVLHDQVAFYQIAEKFPLPKGSGTSMTFNGWRKIDAASSTLSEYSASANVAVRLSSRKISATIASYGRSIQLTDTLELTSILPVEPGALAELEQSAALSVDNIIQLAVFKNVLVGSTGQFSTTTSGILSAFLSARASSLCANTGTTGNSRQFGFPVVFGTSCVRLSAVASPSAGNASISARMGPIAIRKAVSRLKRLNVKPMASGSYVGIIHPNAISTMLGNADYKQYIVNYVEGPRETMYKHVVTKVHGVEFIESANVPRFVGAGARGKKINLTFICGKGAVGVTELDGGVKMIMKRPGPSSTDNPYDLFSTLAFKVRAAAAALNPSCGVIVVTSEGRGEGVY